MSLNNNQILGHQNGSIPAVFFEGGGNNQLLNNTITAGPQGGAPLQLQTLGGTPNSGFVVSQNTFDSSNLVLIGLNNTNVTNNYFSNRTLGNSIGIEIAGPYTGTSQNITIDGNTVDATVGSANGAFISGLPQDPGGTSNIDGLSITNNILKGTGSGIAVQSLDQSNFTDNSLIGSNKTNVTITGNQLSSLWTGSSIDIRGGAGSVDKVLVQSNTLQNSAGAQNVITEDAHTTNATILNQGAIVVNDGGSPLISSGLANSNSDPTATLTGTTPAGPTVTVSDGGSTHPTPPNAPDVTLHPPSTGPTLDARQFSTVTHAGTVSDPWPGSAILSALMALPATGGTVMVADGVWKIDSLLQLDGVNNFNLVGQSLNAQLMFTGAGQMWFGGNSGVSNATISTLTINDSMSPQSAMRISDAQNSSFNNNQILGNQNGSIPAVFFEGGSNNQFLNNTITAGPQGGAPLQLQDLGGTPNSGFVVSQNTFDSSNLQLIGLNNTKVTNNYFSNRTQGDFIGILVAGPYTGTSQNITIDSNTLDATVVPGHENGAIISGIPQDPGGTSNIDGFFITNNTIKGTGSFLAAQSNDPSNFADNSLIGSNKTNVTITGNQLSSLWAGSRSISEAALVQSIRSLSNQIRCKIRPECKT